MEYNSDEHEALPDMPVSPNAHYFNSSVLSFSIVAVLESEVPLDDFTAMPWLKDVFLPINARFSSIMVEDEKGVKKWKKVEVKLEDHIYVPTIPTGKSPEFYEDHFNDYLSKVSLDRLPQNKPLWEFHVLKYPTSNAAGHLIFKIHHSLGDGYSLVGALLSCFKRAENPSLPLTFPSRESSMKKDDRNNGIFGRLGRVFSTVRNTVSDVGSTLIKGNIFNDAQTRIRSTEDGAEFRPSAVTTLTFPLDRIKEIKTKLGVTVNDVIMGVIFLGTRLYMQQSSSPDDDDPNAEATALMVVNTRAIGGEYKTIEEMVKPNSKMPWGNRFIFMPVSMPKLACNNQVDSNPLRFVKEAHWAIKRKRNSAAVYLTGWMMEILRKVRGPEAAARYFYNTMKSSSLAMSNLIGPVEQIAVANHPIKGLYFLFVGSPESLAITILSYVDNLRIAIRTEKDFMDPKKFNSCIANAYKMIYEAAVQNEEKR